MEFVFVDVDLAFVTVHTIDFPIPWLWKEQTRYHVVDINLEII